MKAVSVRNGTGDANALFVDENVPDPVPRSGQILVRVKCFGLNRMDIMQREGKYPYALLPDSGNIMGVEFSGHVEQVGPDCSLSFKKGDKVFGLVYGGAYAELVAIDEEMLMEMPDGMDFETAAGIPETYFTATQAVHLVAAMEPGQRVLIHAAASGVGQAAIQVAKSAGASQIFATAGTDDKCQLCKSLGADVAVNYRNEDFAEVIKRETDGKGVNLIIDLVGRDYWHRNVASAAMDSKIVLVALMSGGIVDQLSLRELMNRRLLVLPTTLRTRSREYQKSLKDTVVERVVPRVASGEMKLVLDQVLPWTQVSDAHKRLESGAGAGKIICQVV
ncbi:quinone oxidoreductase putative [Thozetella sp. PMI_491]|nr:quinone oxidoreductase putative [Thozetella sp. PMI_491]